MDRLPMGLGIGCVLLGASTLYFMSANASLDQEMGQLQSELEGAQAELSQTKEKLDAAKKAAAAAPRNRPRRLPVLSKGGGVGPGAAAGGAGGMARERLAQMRDKVREQAFSRMVGTVQSTGDKRGWDQATIDEAAAILQDSWSRSNEIRERMRSREIEPMDARDEMSTARDGATAELEQLLGAEEHQALKDQLRNNAIERDQSPG